MPGCFAPRPLACSVFAESLRAGSPAGLRRQAPAQRFRQVWGAPGARALRRFGFRADSFSLARAFGSAIFALLVAKIYLSAARPPWPCASARPPSCGRPALPPNLLRASFVERFTTCGKPNCACARGQKHGPFYYLTANLGVGQIRKFLLKTPAHSRPCSAGSPLTRRTGAAWRNCPRSTWSCCGGANRWAATPHEPPPAVLALHRQGLRSARPARGPSATTAPSPRFPPGCSASASCWVRCCGWPRCLHLQAQTGRRGWQRLVGWKQAISDDAFGLCAGALPAGGLAGGAGGRQPHAQGQQGLRVGQDQRSLVVALDANEQFKSRCRCCRTCCQRRVEVKDAAGQTQTVTEYYHRQVYAQLHGPDFSVILDLEPIRPGRGRGGGGVAAVGADAPALRAAVLRRGHGGCVVCDRSVSGGGAEAGLGRGERAQAGAV